MREAVSILALRKIRLLRSLRCMRCVALDGKHA